MILIIKKVVPSFSTIKVNSRSRNTLCAQGLVKMGLASHPYDWHSDSMVWSFSGSIAFMAKVYRSKLITARESLLQTMMPTSISPMSKLWRIRSILPKISSHLGMKTAPVSRHCKRRGSGLGEATRRLVGQWSACEILMSSMPPGHRVLQYKHRSTCQPIITRCNRACPKIVRLTCMLLSHMPIMFCFTAALKRLRS